MWCIPVSIAVACAQLVDDAGEPMDVDETGATRPAAAAPAPVRESRWMNAPTLPKAPRYKGSTTADKRAFVREYETYYYQCIERVVRTM